MNIGKFSFRAFYCLLLQNLVRLIAVGCLATCAISSYADLVSVPSSDIKKSVAVAEPGSIVLLALGLVSLVAIRRRKLWVADDF